MDKEATRPIYVSIRNIALDIWEVWASDYPSGTYRNTATAYLLLEKKQFIGRVVIKGDHTAESCSINSALQKYFEGRKVIQIKCPEGARKQKFGGVLV